MTKWRGDMTLREVWGVIDEHLQPGASEIDCPACTRRVHADRRKIDVSMARALGKLYEWDDTHPGEWMDYRNWKARGEARTHTLLRHDPWALIEGRDKKLGPMAGWWRITRRGRDFCDTDLRIPYYIWTFKGACIHWSKKRTTSFIEALDDQFDLDEVLGRPSGRKQP